MSDSDLVSLKRRLRREMLARLAATSDARPSAGRALAAALMHSAPWRTAARLVLFLSRRDEIDTAPILDLAFEDRRPVLLPRMTEDSTLQFVVVSDLGVLSRGRFGILEPPRDAPASELTGGDLVLVPGMAFDGRGGRLGRGFGYYDRAFARCARARERPTRIGAGFSFQLVERVPMADHDVRMDGFVSESGIILFDLRGLGESRVERRVGRGEGE